MDNNILWDAAKFIVTIIVIPFGVWIVSSHIKIKASISHVKEDALRFREEVAKSYASKHDMESLASHIDNKITIMQNAVTQRIDTMQSNLATMIASLVKGRD